MACLVALLIIFALFVRPSLKPDLFHVPVTRGSGSGGCRCSVPSFHRCPALHLRAGAMAP